MKIEAIRRARIEELSTIPIDVTVMASGYESRAHNVAKKLGAVGMDRIVLGFLEHTDLPTRLENDAVFNGLGYREIPLSGETILEHEEIHNYLDNMTSDPARILIDITSMTRLWYGGIVSALRAYRGDKTIVTYFTYTPAQYNKPSNLWPPNETVGAVHGFSSLSLPDRPTALILGLGQEQGRAIGLYGHLDPSLIALFYADPGIDLRYKKDLMQHNDYLIKLTSEEHRVAYPLLDPIIALQKLESMVVGLRRNWQVVLASLGPKIFGLCCFLVASHHEDTSVWRVTAGLRHEPKDRKPSKSTTVLEIEWQN